MPAGMGDSELASEGREKLEAAAAAGHTEAEELLTRLAEGTYGLE